MKLLKGKRTELDSLGEIVAHFCDDSLLWRKHCSGPRSVVRCVSRLACHLRLVLDDDAGGAKASLGKCALSCGTRALVVRLSFSSLRPVLKHGPRSLTCVRALGCHALLRNESEGWDALHQQPTDQLREV